jgi:hypothetical protein
LDRKRVGEGNKVSGNKYASVHQEIFLILKLGDQTFPFPEHCSDALAYSHTISNGFAKFPDKIAFECRATDDLERERIGHLSQF